MVERTKKIESLSLYTLTEIEPILGVTHRTLFNYIKSGKLKAKKIGGKWKVTKEVLEDFVYGQHQETPAKESNS